MGYLRSIEFLGSCLNKGLFLGDCMLGLTARNLRWQVDESFVFAYHLLAFFLSYIFPAELQFTGMSYGVRHTYLANRSVTMSSGILSTATILRLKDCWA